MESAKSWNELFEVSMAAFPLMTAAAKVFLGPPINLRIGAHRVQFRIDEQPPHLNRLF